MKKNIVFFFILCSLHTIAQEKLKLEINNPEPRVGQRIQLSIDIQFISDYIEKGLKKNIKTTRSLHGIQSNDFKKTIVFEKSKKYTIGPFNFEFNGKEYTTNSIEVNVLPKLPLENGLWVRLTELEGEKYLILEQLISNESNKSSNESGGYSHTVGGVKPQGIEFASLLEVPVKGIEFWNYSSESYTIRPEDAELFDVGFSYSMKKYKIKFDEDFIGTYMLSTEDIENLPKEFKIGKISIEK